MRQLATHLEDKSACQSKGWSPTRVGAARNENLSLTQLRRLLRRMRYSRRTADPAAARRDADQPRRRLAFFRLRRHRLALRVNHLRRRNREPVLVGQSPTCRQTDQVEPRRGRIAGRDYPAELAKVQKEDIVGARQPASGSPPHTELRVQAAHWK